jgi:5-methylcytosine-specific restriction endonuclease McrA
VQRSVSCSPSSDQAWCYYSDETKGITQVPSSPARPCNTIGCYHTQPCPAHPRKPFESTHARRRYGSSGWDWTRTVQLVLVRDNRSCQLHLPGCAYVATTADHILSPRQGGTDHVDNLRAVCEHCNKARQQEQSRIASARR